MNAFDPVAAFVRFARENGGLCEEEVQTLMALTERIVRAEQDIERSAAQLIRLRRVVERWETTDPLEAVRVAVEPLQGVLEAGRQAAEETAARTASIREQAVECKRQADALRGTLQSMRDAPARPTQAEQFVQEFNRAIKQSLGPKRKGGL